jgi:hypothetical protein
MLKAVATSLSSVMGDPWLCLDGRALERRATAYLARHMPGQLAKANELISLI